MSIALLLIGCIDIGFAFIYKKPVFYGVGCVMLGLALIVRVAQ